MFDSKSGEGRGGESRTRRIYREKFEARRSMRIYRRCALACLDARRRPGEEDATSAASASSERMGLSLISASSPDPSWDFPAFIGSRLIKARSLRVHSRARRTFEAPPIKMDASKMAAGSSCSGACVVLSMCWVVRVMGCVYPCCRGTCRIPCSPRASS